MLGIEKSKVYSNDVELNELSDKLIQGRDNLLMVALKRKLGLEKIGVRKLIELNSRLSGVTWNGGIESWFLDGLEIIKFHSVEISYVEKSGGYKKIA